MTFGEKLQRLRAREGLSQDALAELLEVSRQAVSKWEREEAMPEAEKLVRISQCFHVTTDYLLKDGPEHPAQTAPGTLHALGAWYCRRGWLLGVPVALWGGVRLLGLCGKWDSVSQLVLEGQMSTVQGILWLLLVNKEQVGAAAGLLLAGILWTLLGRRRSGGLRWYHAGWPLAVWGAADVALQCALIALMGLAAAPEFSREELSGQMTLLWQSMGAQAVYGGGMALMGLAVALGGRRLDRAEPRR